MNVHITNVPPNVPMYALPSLTLACVECQTAPKWPHKQQWLELQMWCLHHTPLLWWTGNIGPICHILVCRALCCCPGRNLVNTLSLFYLNDDWCEVKMNKNASTAVMITFVACESTIYMLLSRDVLKLKAFNNKTNVPPNIPMHALLSLTLVCVESQTAPK